VYSTGCKPLLSQMQRVPLLHRDVAEAASFGGGTAPLFASQRVSLGAAPTAGTDGHVLGPGAVSFTRVDTMGCYEDGGREAQTNGGAVQLKALGFNP
jgi:hypothetical protein